MANKILVVDDEPNIVLSLEFLMKQAGFQVRTAADGEAALAAIAAEQPDLVLLDVMMPRKNGYEVCQAIRANPDWQSVRIVMLTAKGREVEREKGLALGADDYITKPFSPRELVARVRAVLRRAEGERDAAPILRAGDLTIDFGRRSVRVGSQPVDLTATEFDLLAILAREPGRPFTRAQLLELAYDVNYAGFDRTVDAHIKNLRRKIEPDPRSPTYVLTIYGVGYKFAENLESAGSRQ